LLDKNLSRKRIGNVDMKERVDGREEWDNNFIYAGNDVGDVYK
jgi:hypothetical protein